MNTTPTSFSGFENVNMVKKFYIFSCAALVAYLCLFPQDARAGGDPKFSGRAFLEISGERKAGHAADTAKIAKKTAKRKAKGASPWHANGAAPWMAATSRQAQRATMKAKKAKKGQQGGIISPGDFDVYQMLGGNLE